MLIFCLVISSLPAEAITHLGSPQEQAARLSSSIFDGSDSPGFSPSISPTPRPKDSQTYRPKDSHAISDVFGQYGDGDPRSIPSPGSIRVPDPPSHEKAADSDSKSSTSQPSCSICTEGSSCYDADACREYWAEREAKEAAKKQEEKERQDSVKDMASATWENSARIPSSEGDALSMFRVSLIAVIGGAFGILFAPWAGISIIIGASLGLAVSSAYIVSAPFQGVFASLLETLSFGKLKIRNRSFKTSPISTAAYWLTEVVTLLALPALALSAAGTLPVAIHGLLPIWGTLAIGAVSLVRIGTVAGKAVSTPSRKEQERKEELKYANQDANSNRSQVDALIKQGISLTAPEALEQNQHQIQVIKNAMKSKGETLSIAVPPESLTVTPNQLAQEGYMTLNANGGMEVSDRNQEKAQQTIEEFKNNPNSVPTQGKLVSIPEEIRPYKNCLDPNGCLKIHGGYDWANKMGFPVRSTTSGKVLVVDKEGGYGRYVIIDAGINNKGERVFKLLGHFGNRNSEEKTSGILVQEGETLKQNEIVGLLGNSGQVSGPHVHEETFVVPVGASESKTVDDAEKVIGDLFKKYGSIPVNQWGQNDRDKYYTKKIKIAGELMQMPPLTFDPKTKKIIYAKKFSETARRLQEKQDRIINGDAKQ